MTGSVKKFTFKKIINKTKRIFFKILRNMRFLCKRLFSKKINILVKLNWRLGDEIMTIPIYQAIKEKFPNSFLAVSVNYSELLINNLYVDGINLDQCKYDYDKVINLQGTERDQNRTQYLAQRIKFSSPLVHPKIYLSPEEKQASAFGHINLKGNPVIGVSTDAGWECKKWPLSRYKQVCQYLKDKYNAEVIQLGKGSRWMGLGLNLIDQTTVREAAIILEKCNLFLGNDSGLMHLALAIGTPTVALFGPTDPKILIQGNKNFLSIWSNIECRGCWNNYQMKSPGICPTKTSRCMDIIGVERVISVIATLGEKNKEKEVVIGK